MKHARPARHIAAKTVIAAFLLSFAVFCSVIVLAALSQQKATDDPTKADAPLGRVRTAVLFFRNTADELTGAVILTTDTRQLTMSAVGYAPDFEIGGRRLQELYASDAQVAGAQLCEAAGTFADGVLSFSVSNVAALLVYLKDRLPLTLPEQVGILPAGASTLTPMQVADVLRYREWSDGDVGCARIHAQVVATIFNRYLTPERDLEAAFSKLTELCDDRLSISQFEAIRTELTALAKANDGALCNAKPAHGP